MNASGRFLSVALFSIAAASLAQAQVTVDYIARLGLLDAEHTGSAGYQESYARAINDAGDIIGYSGRIVSDTTSNGQDAWVGNTTGLTTQIGFTGVGYTGSGGYQESVAQGINVTGHIIGYSRRITGVNSSNGQDAWVANTAGLTTQIGFTGAGYTGSGGYQYSVADGINAAGDIIGFTGRVTGVNTSNGQDTWVAMPSGLTIQIGLSGADYTGSSGYRSSVVQQINAAGNIIGFTQRVTGERSQNGLDTWVANTAGLTTQVGLTGPGYTGSAGYRVSEVWEINAAGDIIGDSQRITGVNSYNGLNAWVANPAGITTQIGFTGAGYTGSEGYQFSQAQRINATGHIIGASQRVTGTNSSDGQDAWVANTTGLTTQIGLTGTGYTGSEGYQRSQAQQINAAGDIIGYSQRVTGINTSNGQNAWVANTSGLTTRIGLTGAGYTGSAGYEYGFAQQINATGKIIGYSQRVTGFNSSNGQDAWVADTAGLTTRIGLNGTGYVRAFDGYAYSFVEGLTDSGYVFGGTMRFNSSNADAGRTAWIYDLNTELQTDFLFSVRSTDGYAYSSVNTVLENGLGLGTYELFDTGGISLGNRAFAWLPGVGGFDVGDNLDTLLSTAGWSYLSSADLGNLNNFLLGTGRPLGGNGVGVYLTQIPEPGTYGAFFSLVALGFVLVRRSRARIAPLGCARGEAW